MTRQIKFRCWDTGKRQPMIYFGSKFFMDDDRDTISFVSEKDTHVLGDHDDEGNRFILMQFTGLLDKNGKEIYEGDVVIDHDTKINHRVYWDEEKMQWWVERLTPEPNYSKYPLKELRTDLYDKGNEVIGNIYENKDLLK